MKTTRPQRGTELPRHAAIARPRAALAFCLCSALCATSAIAAPTPERENDPADAPITFRFDGLDGETHRLTDYRGKWVIVNFWATWCAPCIHEIPELNRFYRRYRERGVAMLGVNYEELTPPQIKQALETFKIDYTVVYVGENADMSAAMALLGMPTTFVISPQGALLKTWLGPVTERQLEAYLKPRLDPGDG